MHDDEPCAPRAHVRCCSATTPPHPPCPTPLATRSYLYVSKYGGEQVVTFLPAQLAEDHHDVDHMILKYEQG